jgi:hypothetical protein
MKKRSKSLSLTAKTIRVLTDAESLRVIGGRVLYSDTLDPTVSKSQDLSCFG